MGMGCRDSVLICLVALAFRPVPNDLKVWVPLNSHKAGVEASALMLCLALVQSVGMTQHVEIHSRPRPRRDQFPGILFDHNGKVCSSAGQEFQQYHPQPGWVERRFEPAIASSRLDEFYGGWQHDVGMRQKDGLRRVNCATAVLRVRKWDVPSAGRCAWIQARLPSTGSTIWPAYPRRQSA
jgi:hypothetical protein